MMSMFAVTLFCIMWSSALFYAEQSYSYLDENSLWRYTSDNSQSPFQSIPHTMWFAMVTMTTVGYGDFTPTSPIGKFVAGLTMITGVIIIALPITILASNFSLEYSKQMVDDKLRDDYKIYQKRKKNSLYTPGSQNTKCPKYFNPMPPRH